MFRSAINQKKSIFGEQRTARAATMTVKRKEKGLWIHENSHFTAVQHQPYISMH